MGKRPKILKISNAVILSLIAIVIIGAFIIVKQANNIKTLRSSMTNLFPGEKVDYFDLIGTDNEKRDAATLKTNDVSLIYIFEQPCTPCNNNITMWKKIAGILEDKIKVYGVILNEIDEVVNLSEALSLNFELYSPVDIKKFKKKFRVTPEVSQTILLMQDNVTYCKTGELETNDYFDIVGRIKGDLK